MASAQVSKKVGTSGDALCGGQTEPDRRQEERPGEWSSQEQRARCNGEDGGGMSPSCPFSQKSIAPSEHEEKDIRQSHTQGLSSRHLANNPPTCRDRQKQGKTEELSWIRVA